MLRVQIEQLLIEDGAEDGSGEPAQPLWDEVLQLLGHLRLQLVREAKEVHADIGRHTVAADTYKFLELLVGVHAGYRR